MPPLQRTAHYFSRGEYHTALLLLWLGVLDLREQFPIWPIAHPNPLDGAPGVIAADLKWSRGLIAIAKEANIEHGHEVGSSQPYVASLDLVATVPRQNGIGLSIFSSKPIKESGSQVKWRTLERLELERRYALEMGARYSVSSSALIPIHIAGQLEWWLDCSTLHFAPELLSLAPQFANVICSHPELALGEAVECAAKATSINLDNGWLLFRHCAWKQLIDIDPSSRILTSHPMRSGGFELRNKLRLQLFGETWS